MLSSNYYLIYCINSVILQNLSSDTTLSNLIFLNLYYTIPMSKITNLFLLPILCSLLVVFSACNNTNPDADGSAAIGNSFASVTSSISPQATNVTIVNAKSIMDKADYDAVKEMDFFADWAKEATLNNPKLMELLNDPTKSGLQLNGEVAYVTVINEMGEPQTQLIFPIADAEKMKNALVAMTTDNPLQDKGDYQMMALSSNQAVVFNDKIGAVVETTNESIINSILNPQGEGLKQNENFSQNYAAGNDVLVWSNSSNWLGMLQENPMLGMGLGMAQISMEDLKNNYAVTRYNFEDGAVTMKSTTNLNPSLKDKLGNMTTDKFVTNYADVFPKENMLMNMSIGLDMKGILRFMTPRGFVKLGSAQTEDRFGLSLPQMEEALAGDVSFGLYGTEESAAVLFAIGIKDKSLLENAFFKLNMQKEGDAWTWSATSEVDPTATPVKYTLKMKDDMIIASTDVNLLDKAMKGGQANDLVSDITNGWMGMYVDFENIQANGQKIANLMGRDPSEISPVKMEKLSSLKLHANGNEMTGRMETADDNVSSLKTLIQLMNEVYIQQEKAADEFDDFEEEFGEMDTDAKTI